MTIGEAEKTYQSRLAHLYDEQEAGNLAIYCLEHLLRQRRGELLMNKLRVLTASEEASLLMTLDQLEEGEPVQYIIGETEFYGLRLQVNPAVLIPRPETEELVDWVISSLRDKKTNPQLQANQEEAAPPSLKEIHRSSKLTLLDIGTGSGCIAIALKKNLPHAQVIGVDISAAVTETALRNAVRNNVEAGFITADILKPDHLTASLQNLIRRGISGKDEEAAADGTGGTGQGVDGFLDLIVSNPPYITLAEKNQMHQNVLDFEPHTSLFVPDDDPLKFYRAIADFGRNHLKAGGLLFFEINERFGEDVVAMLRAQKYSDVILRTDLMGKNRMIKAVLL